MDEKSKLGIEYNRLNHEINTLQEKEKEIRTKIDELNKEFKQLRQAFNEKEYDVKATQNEIKQLNADLVAKESELRHTEEELEQSNETLTLENNELHRLNSVIQRLKLELTDKEKDLDDEDIKLKDLSTQEQKLKEKISKLEQEETNFNNQLETEQKNQVDIQRVLEGLEHELQHHNNKFNLVNQDLNNNENENENERKRLDDQDLTSLKASLDDDLEIDKATLKTLHSTLRTIQCEEDEIQHEIDNSDSEIDSLNRQLQGADEKDQSRIKLKIEEYLTNKRKRQNDLKNLKTKDNGKNEVEHSIKCLQEKITQSTQLQEKRSNEIKQLSDRIVQLGEKRRGLDDQKRNLEFENDKRQLQFKVEQEKLNEANIKYAKAVKGLFTTQSSLSEMRLREDNFTAKRNDIETTMNQIKLDMKMNKKSDLEIQYQKELQSEKLQKAKDDLSEIKSKKSTIESEIKSFKDKSKELEKQIDLQKFQLAQTETNKENCLSDLQSYKLDTMHIRQQITEIDSKKIENMTKLDKISKFNFQTINNVVVRKE